MFLHCFQPSVLFSFVARFFTYIRSKDRVEEGGGGGRGGEGGGEIAISFFISASETRVSVMGSDNKTGLLP